MLVGMTTLQTGLQVRSRWVGLLEKLARPVLSNLAAGTLRANMPVECVPGSRADREQFTHLEAVGRLLAGISPWLELSGEDDEPALRNENTLRDELRDLARRALARGMDPASVDRLNFSVGHQPIVDAAFLAHALLRSPVQLWERSDALVRDQLREAFIGLRDRKPGFCNWLLFSAITEAALARFGGRWDPMRVDYALRQHEQWFVGNGLYKDGPNFHADYYNSYVIQPMLIDTLRALHEAGQGQHWPGLLDTVLMRACRYAEIQERTINVDGSFAPIGRSLAYRCGAFQHLAQMALQQALPATISPAQARGALDAVVRRTTEAPDTFDENGWLTIGLCGHQPSIGEGYISTGSTYLCSAALLPLGLPASDPFWTDAPVPFTQQKVWAGVDVPADHD